MIETEVKFAVSTLAEVSVRLAGMGGAVLPRQFERNWVFDTPDGQLQRAGQLLRLREDDQIRLTHKSPVVQSHAEAKQMVELELCVSDAPVMTHILAALGYSTVRVYEKFRQTVSVADVHVCLDTLPFGFFVELEGAVPDIRAMAIRLGLPWETRILDNYLALFEQAKTHLGVRFEDMTFANFDGLNTAGIKFRT